MSRYPRLSVLNAMVATGMIPVFYEPDADTAWKIATACADGGAKLIEFTNRGDGAINVFAELQRRARAERPDLMIGVGSIVDPYTAGQYIAQGAEFVVGPCLNAEVAKLCNRRKVAYSPGCSGTSEINNAEELGCEIVKIFPGGLVGGPAFVKAHLGPCPWSRLMPTGGVEPTRESLSAWFGAGVACVGIGSNLITKALVKAGDFAGLTAKVKETRALIDEIRAAKK